MGNFVIRCLTLFALAFSPAVAFAEPATQPSSPIAWRPWSDDVFAQAKKEHKFVLLDLEAVWCHWCHVQDETTYHDPAVAKLIAGKYIPVKVDQDSRPDISNRYEDYGWPATVVFNDDGKEIVTRQGYIPPAAMASMLQAIIDDPTPGPSVHAAAAPRAGGAALSDDVRAELARRTSDTYDEKYGAWGRVQKFMDWDAVEWCIAQAAAGDARAEHMARGTLAGQLHLIDPAWGGVYQYSTDGDWDHPHFEKIMQMQAEDLRAYSIAYATWHDETYLKAAGDIHKFLASFLKSPEGAFYTSMDADLVPGEHSADYFKLDDAGRRKLGVPKVDQHRYARENGWAINALSTLFAATGDPQPLDEAKSAAAWIIANRSIDGGGFRHNETDPAGPYLGDTLSMGRAMLTLYADTGDRAWLRRADAAGAFIETHFTAPDVVGVATSDLSRPGPFRPRPELDENVAAARFANLLFRYTGEAAHKKLAGTAMNYLAAPEVAESRPTMVTGILLADAEVSTDPLHLTIVGGKNDPAAQALFAKAAAFGRPYKRLEWYDPAEGPLPNADVEYPVLKRPAAFVCTGNTCSSPVFTPADLEKKLTHARH